MWTNKYVTLLKICIRCVDKTNMLLALSFVSVMWKNKYVTQCIVSSYVDKLLHGHIVSGLADKCYPPRIFICFMDKQITRTATFN